MISFTEQAAGGVWPLGDKDPFSSVGWYLLRPFYYCCRWSSRETEGQGLTEKMRGRERLEKEQRNRNDLCVCVGGCRLKWKEHVR